MNTHLREFWNLPIPELLQRLQTTPQGLTRQLAAQRLKEYGANLLQHKQKSGALKLFLTQFQSPIILILMVAAGLSFFLDAPVDALIILAIVFISSLLGFWQEWGAANALEKLLALIKTKVTVVRDRIPQDILLEQIVPGDIIHLAAGDSIPGDCRILESKALFVNEAALTGETYPVTKTVEVLRPEIPLNQRTNALFMGTHVVSGTATAVVVLTGSNTELGQISERLEFRRPETEFEQGVRLFGSFLLEVTLYLVIAIFAFNVYLDRPVLESFLFTVALAVGLTPQLLPAIISVNLARGAKRLADKKVIVKRLVAIENFGSMNVLCSDKTGTVTEGVVRIRAALDMEGKESEAVLFYAYLNAMYETGFVNPIDQAIRSHRSFELAGYQKLDEFPYDFIRKRLSILVTKDGNTQVITKGALNTMLDICSLVETSDGRVLDLEPLKAQIQHRFETLSHEGFRTIGVAYRDLTTHQITQDDETNMTFLGCLLLYDPPKPEIVTTIHDLEALGITLKMITGDSHAVAASITQQLGQSQPKILTGSELRQMSDEALLRQVNAIDVFAEIEPNQKERIILALRRTGNVVGYIGDGINDATALHTADVGISVDSAVDVAKEAADIVLLEKDLGVLVEGVRQGRIVFANTLKYVFMATSANFGNMFSMAGISLFIPFLPLLPKQILLTNLLTDIPQMTIATDRVDRELTDRPRRWDIRFIRNFMLVFGSISAFFDFLTFAVLLLLLKASPEQFRTGWLVESVISASTIVLVIRTRHPFFQSKPGQYLAIATLLTGIVTVALPFSPLAGLFGFQPLPGLFLWVLGAIVILYIGTAEVVKRVFYGLQF
jgi:P-type Mg2+ transporter